jgi:hypothetical protein
VRTVDDQQDTANPLDRLEVYEALVDWPTNAFVFTLVDTILPAPFNVMVCNRTGLGVRDCVPQPDTTATVDALSNRPMMQLKFRDFGTHFAMVFNQTIDASASISGAVDEVAGIRWYELRNTAGPWTIHQQATFAPQPGGTPMEHQLLHRWMASAAMDKHGNIAIGYSIANDDDANEVYPGIRYAGRFSGDPLGLLPQGEQIIANGVESHTFTQRWGDYSAMNVDPADDCTFWYTTHVAGLGGTGGRPTRIASFRFRGGPPVFTFVPPDMTTEQSSLAGTPLVLPSPAASDDCGAVTITSDAPAVFPLGTTVVQFTATDVDGESSTATINVTVEDTTAPIFSGLNASPASLWPPNHKMVAVNLSATVADICDAAPRVRVLSVTSNEPINGMGDGDKAPDWVITGDLQVELRAERSGLGSGREYSILVDCTDASGNSTTATVMVSVPHNL